jgi:hypothetical protein
MTDMRDGEALRVALDLLHVPSRVRMLRTEPLPPGVPLLLRLAAGDPEAERQAAAFVDRPAHEMREAAAFFIEQMLLSPEADSYRVLGASADAGSGELRQNMALLMKWLHPDRDRPGERSVFVHRVTMAWDDLKTPERRAAYDAQRSARDARRPRSRKDGRANARGRAARPARSIPRRRTGLLRALWHLLGGAKH